MTLLKNSVPKLHHPNYEESETSHNRDKTITITTTSTPDLKPTTSTPIQTQTQMQTPWYHKGYNCSDDEEDEEDEEEDESYHMYHDDLADKTPSPKKLQSHDDDRRHQFDFASTPLNPNSTVSFISPMNKLNALHLESQIDNIDYHDLEHEIRHRHFNNNDHDIYHDNDHNDNDEDEEDEEDEEDGYYDEFSLGNKTIANYSEDEDDEDIIKLLTPKYISSRKRTHLESPDMMMLTPNHNNNNSGNNNNNNRNNLSASNNYNKLSAGNTSSGSGFKFSFSNVSDSTPCPRQPKRKKLKFKQNQKPELEHQQTKNILDLGYAKKTILLEPLSIPLYTEEPSDEIDDNSNKSAMSSKLESTPISQSTPASLRASTPPPPLAPSASDQQGGSSCKNLEHEEYGESINGYKFVKPKVLPHFKYETPLTNNRYHQLRDNYISNNYQIIGELPITSAGMMKDDEDDDIHIGDRRINDPYMTIPSLKDSYSQVRDLYLKELRLPLLPPHFYYQLEDKLSKENILLLITPDNLLKFYQSILLEEENLLELLKQERFKWHPDKWVSKLKDQNHNFPFDLQIVDAICQTINGIIESS